MGVTIVDLFSVASAVSVGKHTHVVCLFYGPLFMRRQRIPLNTSTLKTKRDGCSRRCRSRNKSRWSSHKGQETNVNVLNQEITWIRPFHEEMLGVVGPEHLRWERKRHEKREGCLFSPVELDFCCCRNWTVWLVSGSWNHQTGFQNKSSSSNLIFFGKTVPGKVFNVH